MPSAAKADRVVLVTGGAGFIGSHLVDALVEAGVKVRVLDNFATGRREFVNPAADLIEADIRNADSIGEAFAGVDCVFHVAALPRIPLSIDRPVETHTVNVVGTLNVVLACRAAKVRRIVYSGSSSVYGDQPRMPLVEAMTPNPISPYSLQKLVGEQYLRMYHRLSGIEAVGLRYFNVYGPRMTTEGSYATVIGAFIRARREGRPIQIFGDGEQTRDFTHVRDVARANLLAMDCAAADGRPINVGYGAETSVNRIAALFGGATIRMAERQCDVRRTLADPSLARELLGWSAQVTIEQGLAEMIHAAGLK
jgi:UDP-N-acetylglucosamine/UDP-N-acetyl-alpha-D-glucosaminouronate 4-epimerase